MLMKMMTTNDYSCTKIIDIGMNLSELFENISQVGFYSAACNATHGIAVAILYVRLSVSQTRVL